MAIIKAKQKEYHARIPNETARDKDLTLEAKGLLCVLLSLDNDWKIYKSQITQFSSCKYHKTNRAFNELIEKGYIIDHGRLRDENGRVKENLYEVYAEKPRFQRNKPNRDSPDQVFPSQENQQVSNYTIITNSIDRLEKENQEVNLNINSEQGSLFPKDYSLENKKPDVENKKTLRQNVIEFWLKEFHPGWNFNATDGKKINSLIKKIQGTLKQHRGDDFTDDDTLNLFKHFCYSLDDFYKNETLSVLESKYDSIVERIKQSKNGKPTDHLSKRGVTNFKFNVPDPRGSNR